MKISLTLILFIINFLFNTVLKEYDLMKEAVKYSETFNSDNDTFKPIDEIKKNDLVI